MANKQTNGQTGTNKEKVLEHMHEKILIGR